MFTLQEVKNILVGSMDYWDGYYLSGLTDKEFDEMLIRIIEENVNATY